MRKKFVCVLPVACAVLLLLPSLASADPVLNSHSGWYWGSPRPQGQDLYALECAGLRCYAAGNLGSVVRTDDGGGTWNGLSSGSNAHLRALRILPGDPNSFFATGGCAALGSSDGGTKIKSPPAIVGCSNDDALRSVSFPQGATGIFLLSDGSVFVTSNQGASFSRKQAVPGSRAAGSNAAATSIFFLDLNNGFAVTDNKTSGSIYRTSNGGASWTLVATSAAGLHDIYFATPLIGYAVGKNNAILKTVDGGTSWAVKPVTVGAVKNLTSIRCANENLCLLANESGLGFLRTPDGGTTFSEVNPSDKRLYAVSFVSPVQVLGVGQGGTTVASSDGGLTFAPVGANIANNSLLSGLDALSSSNAFAYGGKGFLASTTDAGKTWTALSGPTTQDNLSTSFASEAVGVVLSAQGALFRTTDRAATWSVLNPGTTQIDSALSYNTATILLTGRRGVLRSGDSGQSFKTVRDKKIRRISALRKVNKTIFGFAASGIFYSGNGGSSWKSIPLPSKTKILINDSAAASCVSTKICWVVTTARRLLSTTNGGKSWTENFGVGDGTDMVQFSTSKSGWATRSDSRRMHRTSDGGKTWRPQILAEDEILDFAIRDKTAYALSSYRIANGSAAIDDTGKSLFATQNGGDFGKSSSLSLKASRSSLKKAGALRISGKLSPAAGGEAVEISYRGVKSERWVKKLVTVASNGTFTHNLKIKTTTAFVAQFAGASNQNGAGSKVITVKVGI